jgi:methylmalonyl-CoA mutase N-terminal domain/subunit
MPYIIESVKSRATLGEISAIFKEVFGAYLPKISF